MHIAAAGQPTSALRPGWWALPLTYGLAAIWVVAMLALGRFAPAQYRAVLQEDQAIEWATAWLFLAAGLLRLLPALRHRRLGDGLVALFCLVVAGEEISWGQRLLGFEPPEIALAYNYQQETTFHNLLQSVVRPKWFLALAVASYGLALPLAARGSLGRRWLDRLGLTTPSWSLAPLFIGAVALLVWYPFTLTSEWVELLVGGLFLAAAPLTTGIIWLALALAIAAGIVTAEGVQAHGRGFDAQRLPCADTEVRALLHDLTGGAAATAKLRAMGSIHKRVWTAETDGYLDRAHTPAFDSATCDNAVAPDSDRRRYGVDPWGTSYWVSVQRIDRGRHRVVVYSFGPNRRRDGTAQTPAGDDVSAIAELRAVAAP